MMHQIQLLGYPNVQHGSSFAPGYAKAVKWYCKAANIARVDALVMVRVGNHVSKGGGRTCLQ